MYVFINNNVLFFDITLNLFRKNKVKYECLESKILFRYEILAFSCFKQNRIFDFQNYIFFRKV